MAILDFEVCHDTVEAPLAALYNDPDTCIDIEIFQLPADSHGAVHACSKVNSRRPKPYP